MTSSTSPKSGSKASAATATDEPFMGTPYIIDMQRPYEYPFPSPATESCPSLLLPYTHSAPLAHAYSSSSNSSASTSFTSTTTPPPPTSLVHRTNTIDHTLGSWPYPSSTNVAHPPISFRPSTLLRRRSSHNQDHVSHLSALTSIPVPIPPRLLARDSPHGLASANGDGRWRKAKRSDTQGTPVK